MQMAELNATEVDCVFGGGAGDTTTVSGPGGTLVRVDRGDGTTLQYFYRADGSVEIKIIRTPHFVIA